MEIGVLNAQLAVTCSAGCIGCSMGPAVQGKIASWWMPDEIVFVEAIPHTGSGKISKVDLRKQLAHTKLPESKL